MRRDKFQAIFTNFHFADNNCLDGEDKFAKLRPLIKLLNQKFQRHSPKERLYSFGESICEYYRRHGYITSSVKFVTTLEDKLVKVTGTIRGNRTEKCPLTSNIALKKQGRGKFDFKTDTKNDVLVCKWNDNSVVNVCSNAAGVHPISEASRYSSSEKKRVQILTNLFLIKLWNEQMGGVDRMDQNLSKNGIAMRGKKWYLCGISNMLDVSINNAWQQ